MNIKTGDIGEMGSYQDEEGEVYLSVTDLINHLNGNLHRVTDEEKVTLGRFIFLLRSFERQIKEL